MQFHDCLTGHRDKLDRSLARPESSGEKRDATAKEVMHKSRVIKTNFAQVCRAWINAIEFYIPERVCDNVQTEMFGIRISTAWRYNNSSVIIAANYV